jgi:hypothetical protein
MQVAHSKQAGRLGSQEAGKRINGTQMDADVRRLRINIKKINWKKSVLI